MPRELSDEQIEAYLDSRSDVVNSVIALYRALGGGWTSTQPLIDEQTRDQMQERTNWGDLLQ